MQRARRRARRARAREHARRHPRDSRRGAGARTRDVHPRRALHLVLRPVLHVRHDLRAQRQPRLVRAVVSQGLRAHRHRDARGARSRLSHLGERPRRLRSSRGDRRSGHRLSQGRRAKEEAGVRRDGHQSLSRVPRSRRARATRRRRPMQEVEPLVQIYSRGFTGGMYGGRAGRDYVTRTQPDNRGITLGTVVGYETRRADRRRLGADRTSAMDSASSRPNHVGGPTTGFSVDRACAHSSTRGATRQATRDAHARRRGLAGRAHVAGRSCSSARARATPSLSPEIRAKKVAPRRAAVRRGGDAAQGGLRQPTAKTVTVRSEVTLSPASKRPLDLAALREQFGRLGDTPFVLGAVDVTGAQRRLVPAGQRAESPSPAGRRAADAAPRLGARCQRSPSDARAIEGGGRRGSASRRARRRRRRARSSCRAQVYRIEDADAASEAGATEICFDPFLRHPAPPRRAHSRAAGAARRSAASRCACARRRSFARKSDGAFRNGSTSDSRCSADTSGSLPSWRSEGRDVVADYAVNVFNAHTAAELFRFGARRIVASVELTTDELSQLVAPWDGDGFDVFAVRPPRGDDDRALRPLGGVRSRADDVPRSVRAEAPERRADRSRPATPFRSRRTRRAGIGLLHSRPIDGAEFLPRCGAPEFAAIKWSSTSPGDDVRAIVRGYRARARRARRRERARTSTRCAGCRHRVHARALRARGLMHRAARMVRCVVTRGRCAA